MCVSVRVYVSVCVGGCQSKRVFIKISHFHNIVIFFVIRMTLTDSTRLTQPDSLKKVQIVKNNLMLQKSRKNILRFLDIILYIVKII